MFDKLLSKPLSIEIKGQTLSFNSVAEFEFAMAGRTEVPTSKMSELIESTREELKREAKSIKAVERQFVDILSRSIETRDGIGRYLRKIDPHVFSQDHGWRDIMVSLREKDEDYDELRKIAIVKYMQYLTARQELIKHTYSVKKMQDKLKTGGAEVDDTDKELDSNASPALRETVILDSVVLQGVHGNQTDEFARLPKGEAIILPVGRASRLEVYLSKHGFVLSRVDGELCLTDSDGERHELQPGKNIIGRDTVCNITVDSSFRDVSRLHLIIEQLDDDQVRLTDLSAHGTFIPSQALDDAA